MKKSSFIIYLTCKVLAPTLIFACAIASAVAYDISDPIPIILFALCFFCLHTLMTMVLNATFGIITIDSTMLQILACRWEKEANALSHEPNIAAQTQRATLYKTAFQVRELAQSGKVKPTKRS